MIPFILGVITILAVYVGLVQYKQLKEDPEEVEHTEPEVDSDPVKCIPIHRYGLHGQGNYRRFLNATQKELFKKLNYD